MAGGEEVCAFHLCDYPLPAHLQPYGAGLEGPELPTWSLAKPCRRRGTSSEAAASVPMPCLHPTPPHPTTQPAWASHAPPPVQAHLPGVVETFGLDVISLLIHHLHLGVQVPAQVLGEARFIAQEQKRGEESFGPQPPFLPPCPVPLQYPHSGKELIHPFALRFIAAKSSLRKPFVFLSECHCFL